MALSDGACGATLLSDGKRVAGEGSPVDECQTVRSSSALGRGLERRAGVFANKVTHREIRARLRYLAPRRRRRPWP